MVKIEHYSKVVKSEQYLEIAYLYDFLFRSGGIAVRDGFELLLLAEEDITWLDSAARRFEEEASKLKEPEKSHLGLLAAVYRERAEMHQALVEHLRYAEEPTESNSRNKPIAGLGARW